MLTVYLICLLSGGVLVAVSVLLGGGDHDLHADSDFEASLDGLDFDADMDMDMDFDMDMDMDFDVDADMDFDVDGIDHDHDLHVHSGDSVGDAASIWLPFLSLRFWIFTTAFFGLTGTLLSYFSSLKDINVITGISAGVGFIAGFGVSYLLHVLQRGQVSGTIPPKEFIGRTARVMVAVDAEHPGKIQLELHEEHINMIAETVEGHELQKGDTAFIVAVNLREGTAQVVKDFDKFKKVAKYRAKRAKEKA